MACGAGVIGFIRRSSKVSDITSKTFFASCRTGDDGEPSADASNSETEFTKGIGVVITRNGNAFAKAST